MTSNTVIVFLAVLVPVATLLALLGAYLFVKGQEKHLLLVLDRFLSRNITDYSMSDMVRREVKVEQDDDRDEEERVFQDWAAAQGSNKEVEIPEAHS